MLAAQFVTMKVQQSGGAASAGSNPGTMKFMMWGMPLILFFSFYNAPSGLIIYWTVQNIITFIQQQVTNRIMHERKMKGNQA